MANNSFSKKLVPVVCSKCVTLGVPPRVMCHRHVDSQSLEAKQGFAEGLCGNHRLTYQRENRWPGTKTVSVFYG